MHQLRATGMDWEGVWTHLGATKKGLGLTGIDLAGILAASPHRECVLQAWGLSGLGVAGLRGPLCALPAGV